MRELSQTLQRLRKCLLIGLEGALVQLDSSESAMEMNNLDDATKLHSQKHDVVRVFSMPLIPGLYAMQYPSNSSF